MWVAFKGTGTRPCSKKDRQRETAVMSELEPAGGADTRTAWAAGPEHTAAPRPSAPPRWRMPPIPLARSLLLFVTVLYTVLAAVLCVLLFLSARADGWPLAEAWVAPALALATALLLPGLLFAGAKLLEAHHEQNRDRLEQMARALEQMRADLNQLQSAAAHTETVLQSVSLSEAAGLCGLASGSASTAAPEPAVFRQMLDLLEQLRDLGMMTEPQRQQWANQVRIERQSRLTEALHHHIAQRQWPEAGQVLQEMRRTFPGERRVEELAAELTAARHQQFEAELAEAEERLQQLLGIHAWDQIEPLAATLARRYPDEPRVRDLLEMLRQQHAAWRGDELRRLRAEFKEAARARRWSQACAAAQQILDRFPYAKTAKKIRQEIVILRENADAEQRQELEAQFKELLQRQRRAEALEIAERIVEMFPRSKSAAELNKMVPKLRELVEAEKNRADGAADREIR